MKKLQISGSRVSRRKRAVIINLLFYLHPRRQPISTLTYPRTGRERTEELKHSPTCFSEFAESLFTESCKQFERSIEVQSVIKELDNSITKFLHLLSPYFLLQCYLGMYFLYYKTNLFAFILNMVS